MKSRMYAAPTAFESVDEAAHAYADGLLDDGGFISAVTALQTVEQNPMPDREWWDDWVQKDGPLSDLQVAFSRQLIPARLYDAALEAMAKAGHDA